MLNLHKKTMPNHIFFMHVPKTGGTSIDDALQKKYGKQSSHISAAASYQAAQALQGNELEHKIAYSDCFRFREGLLAYEMEKGTRYISGHVPFSQKIWEAYGKKYKYIAVLRHPVKRYLSNYYYNRHKESDHCKLSMDLNDFLDSDLGRSWGYEYIKFFAGIQDDDNYSSGALVDQAKLNSQGFSTIGVLEDLQSFTEEMKSKHRISLRIPHKRKNPKSNYEVSRAELKKIEDICQADLELYDFIKARI